MVIELPADVRDFIEELIRRRKPTLEEQTAVKAAALALGVPTGYVFDDRLLCFVKGGQDETALSGDPGADGDGHRERLHLEGADGGRIEAPEVGGRGGRLAG